MSLLHAIALVVALLLLVYLAIALFRPEKF
jgi:K+-transporting ATPase KdpF subunit